MKNVILPALLVTSAGFFLSGCMEGSKKSEQAAPATPVAAAAATSNVRSKGVLEPHSTEEFNQLLKDNKLVVLDFYAVWCGPCKNFAPKFDALSKEFPNVTFIKIDTQKLPDVSSSYGIQSIPTIVLVKEGKEVGRPNKDGLANALTAFQN